MKQQQPEISAQSSQVDAVLYFIRKLDVGMGCTLGHYKS
jgi:hypothetical protein